MNIVFLGTGTSHGVPTIDCMLEDYRRCRKGVCKASISDPKHRRTRCSIAVEYGQRTVLVDVSLDFREQALREEIRRIDAVLITHSHADHIGGMADIRSYSEASGTALDVYGSAESVERIRQTHAYIFDPNTFVGGGIPRVDTHVINGSFDLFGETVTPIPVHHGTLAGCQGYRIGPVAYIPDMKSIDEEHKAKLQGLSCLILNCLRDTRPHSTHLILEESMALARELRPGRCFFVHMCHDIHYQFDAQFLDPWMQFAHDGLRVSIDRK
jgi:phosphoribosyl 1,2-cyclic phosphate phosphodiesterase